MDFLKKNNDRIHTQHFEKEYSTLANKNTVAIVDKEVESMLYTCISSNKTPRHESRH